MAQNIPAKVPKIIHFDAIGSATEGFLFSTQAANKLPFRVKRTFWLQGIPEKYTRGHHAHYTTQEVLISLQGSITVTTQSAAGEQIFTLNYPDAGLYIPALCWVTLNFSADALLLCLASTDYNEQDYIRDYEEFRRICLASG
ncbi:MAG: sugar 3,4-ketoisomerase [Adhaeribacter sp.]